MSPQSYRESLRAPLPGPADVITARRAGARRDVFVLRRFPLVEALAVADCLTRRSVEDGEAKLREDRLERNLQAFG